MKILVFPQKVPYLVPEAYEFDVSTKLDAYSFGIVLLELITGQWGKMEDISTPPPQKSALSCAKGT